MTEGRRAPGIDVRAMLDRQKKARARKDTELRLDYLQTQVDHLPPEDGTHLYRAWVSLYGGSLAGVRITALRIERRTPKGAWVRDPRETVEQPDGTYDCRLRWVGTGTHKKFAAETVADAIESLRQRTRHRIQHTRNTLEALREARAVLKEARGMTPRERADDVEEESDTELLGLLG